MLSGTSTEPVIPEAEPQATPSGTSTEPVIPEAEPQARLSGTSRHESNLPRSRIEALLAFGWHRSVRDDG
jgi:hypothetical protein